MNSVALNSTVSPGEIAPARSSRSAVARGFDGSGAGTVRAVGSAGCGCPDEREQRSEADASDVAVHGWSPFLQRNLVVP